MFFTRSCLNKEARLDIILVQRTLGLLDINWIMKRMSGPIVEREYKRQKLEMATNNMNKPTQRSDDTATNKIKEVNGDLFSCPKTHSMAHCISADVKMGKGIAVCFKEKFGGVQNLMAQRQESGGLAFLEKGERYIYYLVTKAKYWHKPTYGTLRLSLEKMREHNLRHGVKNLCMPKIGCGLDQLDWNQVSYVINKVYQDTDIEITVYNNGDNNKHGKGKGKQERSGQPGQSNGGRQSRNYLQNQFDRQGTPFLQRNQQGTSRAQEESQRSEQHQSKESVQEPVQSKSQKRKQRKKCDNNRRVKIDRQFEERQADLGYYDPMRKIDVGGQDDTEDRNDKDGGQYKDHKGKEGGHRATSRDGKDDEKRENQSGEKRKDGSKHEKNEGKKKGDQHRKKKDKIGDGSNGVNEHEKHVEGRDGEQQRRKEDKTGDRSNDRSEDEKHVKKGAAAQQQKEDNSEERSKNDCQIAEPERDGDCQEETNKNESEKLEREQTHTEKDGSVLQDISEKERLPHEEQKELNVEEDLSEHMEDFKASNIQKEYQSKCKNAEDTNTLSDNSNDKEETTREPEGCDKGEANNSEEESMRKKKEKKKRYRQKKKARSAAQDE